MGRVQEGAGVEVKQNRMGPPKTAREYAQHNPHNIPDDPVAEKLSHDIVAAILQDLIDRGRLSDAEDIGDKMKERLAEIVGEKLNDHWND